MIEAALLEKRQQPDEAQQRFENFMEKALSKRSLKMVLWREVKPIGKGNHVMIPLQTQLKEELKGCQAIVLCYDPKIIEPDPMDRLDEVEDEQETD